MAGLIPLGGAARSAGGGEGGGGDQQIHHPQATAAAEIPWFWYSRSSADDSGTPSAFKGLELWHHNQPQPQQQLHFFSQQQQQQDLYASATGLEVGPGGGGGEGGSGRASINVFSDESSRLGGGFTTLTLAATTGGGVRGGICCQDCGNQAKKDCPHQRCRTCCKSRGFECANHVKSTWVPAAKRRERLQQLAALKEHHHRQEQRPQLRGEALKLPRENHGRPNASGLELVGNFPADVSSPAVFQCVKVSSVDDPDEQFAYQTAVNIGGHVFRGILYDHGPDHPTYTNVATEDNSSGGGGGLVQPLDLIAAAAAAAASPITSAASVHVSSTTAPFFDASSLYPPPFSTYMAGTQFFPHPRS
ncbi:protein SHI RELATED SEQUENCE 1-like [Syzygium oleosum]|uniref:protein SHI RELATED SEQUENCE 1-like n=1 Tax=Syzygium oleosum TaxID=219896 RepID=UPI0011D1E930|nr:protein SHI RELATED SEQUENCE 1-like [Syzygium oleosum]XP_056169789.1 protein SHI RELATED SEQUENCE 1-like [Syzygium oleosum]XP_056169790.1 protein SHI RELATED SEQUENCE 1-like [Syzygium oleosum]